MSEDEQGASEGGVERLRQPEVSAMMARAMKSGMNMFVADDEAKALRRAADALRTAKDVLEEDFGALFGDEPCTGEYGPGYEAGEKIVAELEGLAARHERETKVGRLQNPFRLEYDFFDRREAEAFAAREAERGLVAVVVEGRTVDQPGAIKGPYEVWTTTSPLLAIRTPEGT